MLTENKLKILILFTVISILSLPIVSSAIITCNYCQVGLCTCQITECQRGMFNAHRTADCSGVPMLRGIFNNGIKTWYPTEETQYYVSILCDDGTKSACTPVYVGGVTPTTTTTTTTTEETITTTEFTETTTTTEETTTTTTTETGGGGGGSWYMWVLVFVVLIVVVLFFFTKRKKAPKSSYETLYKKWSR